MTKRERFLDWVRNGDPDLLPVCMSWGSGVAASFYGKDESQVSIEDQINAAEETGTFHMVHVSGTTCFNAVEFMHGAHIEDMWDESPDGVKRQTQTLVTPVGKLTEVSEFPKHTGQYHREFFVKDEKDIPVFEWFVRNACQEMIKNPNVGEAVRKETADNAAVLHGGLPSGCHVFSGGVELLSSYYMDQAVALYLIYDHQDMMEELFDLHAKATAVMMGAMADTDLDFYTYAINGYEWLSPDLYNRYMVPQAKEINDLAAEQGKLTWLHTCGKLKRIAEAGMYQQMGVDVVESLSSLPTGDIDDLAKTRADIGHDITTRGGMNVELFYAKDPSTVRDKAEQVIADCSGYKHMIGDTNSTVPPYPWANIQAMLDVVKATGRMLG